jgi:hypothetical protein
MKYTSLSESLHETADEAVAFFRKEWGIRSFNIETPIAPHIDYRPTLSATTTDKHVLCVEVSESAYPSALDRLVLGCMNHGLPAKVFVAIPRDARDSQYRENLRRAAESGIGLLETSGARGQIINGALSLSLTGCRPINKGQYPPKYRRALSDAERTFRGGDPVKGCAHIYDEIEDLSRRIAKRTLTRGCWTKNLDGGVPPKLHFQKDPWQNVVQAMQKHCDARKSKCPKLIDTLWGRVLGLIPYRNAVDHKPRTLNELTDRDTRLRTRFESAADTLLELVDAASPLRV